MSSTGKTLGQAIDEVIAALEPFDDAARQTIVRAACEHLGVVEPATAQPITSPPPAAPSAASERPPPREPVPKAITDIRSLRTEKRPTTDVEMACIVAYYLDTLAPTDERKQSISKADVDKYFKQAGHRLPKRSDQLLVNAKAAGYFDSAGRGKYKLNPVGHNLVVHTLPRPGSAS